MPITFPEAALGADIAVPTLDGGPVTVRIPPGTRSGRTFRVKGKGVTTAKATGDLLATVEVAVPAKLSARRAQGARGLPSRVERGLAPRAPGGVMPWPSDRPTRAVYVISVAAELAGLHPQTLRIYERKGLVDPARTGGGSRRYSDDDIAQLRRIQELTSEGLNLAGVQKVLALEAELARRCAASSPAAADGAEEAVEQTHRQYRRDLVPLHQSVVLLPEAVDLPWRSTRTAGRRRPRRRSAAPSRRPRRRATPRSRPTTSSPRCCGQEEGIVLPIIQRLGLAPLAVRNAADDAVGKLPKAYGGEARIGRELQQVLDAADKERAELTDEYLSTEHLLLALADRLGVEREQLLAAMQEVRGSHRVTSQNPEEQYQALERTAATSPRRPAPGRSTRSSGATRRSAASSRCCRAAPRTTRCSSASPASARPPSSRAWPAASSRATCPRASSTSGSSASTSARWSPAPSTAASSRSG